MVLGAVSFFDVSENLFHRPASLRVFEGVFGPAVEFGHLFGRQLVIEVAELCPDFFGDFVLLLPGQAADLVQNFGCGHDVDSDLLPGTGVGGGVQVFPKAAAQNCGFVGEFLRTDGAFGDFRQDCCKRFGVRGLFRRGFGFGGRFRGGLRLAAVFQQVLRPFQCFGAFQQGLNFRLRRVPGEHAFRHRPGLPDVFDQAAPFRRRQPADGFQNFGHAHAGNLPCEGGGASCKCPGGTIGNSPAFQRRFRVGNRVKSRRDG